MRIAILEFDRDQKSATGVRGRAIKSFLEKEGHIVEVLSPEPEQVKRFHSSRIGLVSRISRRLSGRQTLPHLWDFIADRLEPQIRRGRYDAVIGRGQDVAYVLTRPFDCVKILDMANILFLESYYVWGPNLNEVEETFEKEMRVFASVDHILSPHGLFTKYFLQQFTSDGLAQKVVTVPLGCDPPSSRHARYADPLRIVYAGSYYYIQDPYLLAFLTKISPFAIDCYGPSNPNRAFLPAPLYYKGFASGIGFLADYQLGLITVSRDLLRQNSPSTKFAYYFAHGLPVLFPEWMKEGYEYPDCAVPYNEDSFADQVRASAEPARWKEMSRVSREVAQGLTWDRVLTPLRGLLSSGANSCH